MRSTTQSQAHTENQSPNSTPTELKKPQTLISTSDEGHAVYDHVMSSGSVLRFEAKDVRQEKTGLHAHVAIQLNGTLLTHHLFNVNREEERTRLGNRVHDMMSDIDQQAMPKKTLFHSLSIYSLALRKWLQTQTVGEYVAGDMLEPPEFLLEPYILEDAGTIMFGSPGSGKSWLAMAMAVSIDAGSSTLDNPIWHTRKRKVLFVNLERSKRSVIKRLNDVNVALGLSPHRELLMVNERGNSLATIHDAVKRTVEKFGVEVVILDSISRTGAGSLLSDETANKVVDMINSYGCAWLAIGHPPRGDDSHVFGSTHFEAGEDIGIRLKGQRKDREVGISLTCVKANDIAFPPVLTYRLGFDDFGLTTIKSADISDFEDLHEETLSRADKVFREVVEAGSNGITARAIDEIISIGATHVSTALRKGTEEGTYEKLPKKGQLQPYRMK